MDTLQNFFTHLAPDCVSEIFSYLPLEDICVIRWLNKAFYKHTRLSSFWHVYFGKRTQYEYQLILEKFSDASLDGVKEKRVDAEVSSNTKLFFTLCSMIFKDKILDRSIWYQAWYTALTNNKKDLSNCIESYPIYEWIVRSPHYFREIEQEALIIYYYKTENKFILNFDKDILEKSCGYAKNYSFLKSVYSTRSSVHLFRAAAQAGNLRLIKELDHLFDDLLEFMDNFTEFPLAYNTEVTEYLIEGKGKTIKDYEEKIKECGFISSQKHLVQYFNNHKELFKKSEEESGLMWEILCVCIGNIDPDVHFSLISQLHNIDPNEMNIEYIYEYCIEHGHDYLSHKLKLLVPDIQTKIRDKETPLDEYDLSDEEM